MTEVRDKRVSLRITSADAKLIADLALGDETVSQTVRRVLREAHERLAKAKSRQR